MFQGLKRSLHQSLEHQGHRALFPDPYRKRFMRGFGAWLHVCIYTADTPQLHRSGERQYSDKRAARV
ncbi:hypothetical protein EYF80_023867 [Liparis tanakae]|uniref:Uncharacterized protein n=1 Tax=Liparis tanakae TaxID=230148 RepID=A0A4Z2HJB0_9TELE|nr:hypothetical protein EYF80_023867 [Liparis tanakae]